ncbi:MAG: copper transporter [Acidimicrobiia bacterium]|nr:copper transporter [Acidimicrobiia bacterium]
MAPTGAGPDPMINLRYHIVSITAVFLALGIGVALGSTLIERAVVDELNSRLDAQAERLDNTDGENARLQDDLEEVGALWDRLAVEGTALFAGHLADTPVVLITIQGTNDDLLALTQRSLRQGGARLHGVLRLTSRWEELDDEEIAELSALVEREPGSADVTRSLVLGELASELSIAAEPPPPEEPDPVVEGVDGQAGGGGVDAGEGVDGAPDGMQATDETPAGSPEATLPDPTVVGDEGTDPPVGDGEDPPIVDEPVEPNGLLLAALIERGYVEFLADSATVPLPEFGARYVVVVDGGSGSAVDSLLMPILQDLAGPDAAPVVVAEPMPEPDDDAEIDGEGPPLAGPLVSAIRSDPRLRASITTVDVAARFIGQSAIVLGLADLAELDSAQVGHYGLADGASSLVPVTEG